jgi:hypothetical protein
MDLLHKQVEEWNISDINYFLGYEDQAELESLTLEELVLQLDVDDSTTEELEK